MESLSNEAVDFNSKMMETIYHASITASCDISKNRKLKSSYVPSGQYLRIYTGTEDIESLLFDLDFAFKRMRQYVLSRVGDAYLMFW